MSWLNTFPGLVYSPSVNAGFCKHCVLFGKTESGQALGVLVSRPLTNMHKATLILRDHFVAKDGRGKLSHALSVADAMQFIQYMEQRLQPIDVLLNSGVAEQVAENRKKLKSILKTVILCGQQNLPLRGHRDDSSSTSTNKGNFLALLEFRAEAGDSVLAKHFESTSSRSTYTSKTIQNELIHACGSYIREKILEEVREAEYFSVIADEATDTYNYEQLSIVLRFVDAEKNVQEEFVGFSECKSGVTGEALPDNIVENLASTCQLNMQKLCGQAYDGAGAMAGKTRGVAARIMASYPKAVYTHCSSHVLNLCVVRSANIPDVRNMMDIASSVAAFFNNSPKRQLALQQHITDLHQEHSELPKRKKLKDLCRTRWVERHDAFEAFTELYEAVVSCMEEITESSATAWNQETISGAQSHLRAIVEFRFILTLVVTKNVLAYTKGLSVKLQGRWQDIIRAHDNIKSVRQSLEDARKNVDLFHSTWFQEASQIASAVNVEPSVPRTTHRQTKQANTPASSPSEYYQRVITIPFLDHLITELKDRFSEHNERAVKILTLLPPSIFEMEGTLKEEHISGFLSLYRSELPSPSTLNTELHCWSIKWKRDKQTSDRCNTVVKTLGETDPDFFPNIHVLLRIAATHPVTSCACERSISKLRLVKTVLRSSMTEERLNGLALLHVHPDRCLDLDQIVDIFARQHPRRMKLQNILD